MGRLAITVLFLAAAGLGFGSADGTAEVMRARQATLDTLISTRKVLFKSKWSSLGKVEGQIRDLSQPDSQGPPDGELPGQERLNEMIRVSSRLEFLLGEKLRILQSMQELSTEILTLQAEIEKIRTSQDRNQQILEGRWTMTMMPSGTRGEINLTQNGTILAGDYRLENGQSGSLQGIFVNSQVLLERIDAKFGKMGRLEGALGKDRLSVKGTWVGYDLTSGQPITGAFTMDKIQEDRVP